MPENRRRKPLGRALQEVIAPASAGAALREERAPSAGLLAHPARAALFQLLLDQPLSNVAQIARALRTTAPSARWHIDVLEHAGLVQTRRGGRSLVAWVPGTAEGPHVQALEALRRPRALGLIHAVSETPGMTVGEVARAAQTTPQSALRALSALAGAELVETVREGRHVRCYPGDGLERLVDERADALPAQVRRVHAAVEEAGETMALVRRARGEVTFTVGRRGARREFVLRSDAPLVLHPRT